MGVFGTINKGGYPITMQRSDSIDIPFKSPLSLLGIGEVLLFRESNRSFLHLSRIQKTAIYILIKNLLSDHHGRTQIRHFGLIRFRAGIYEHYPLGLNTQGLDNAFI